MNSKTESIVLYKVRFKIATKLGNAVAQMTTIKDYDELAEAIAVEIEAAMLAEKIIDHDLRVDFPYPATWWEHLKLTILPRLPRWWGRRMSVKLDHYYHLINVQQYVGYPKANEILEDRWGRPVVFDGWHDFMGAGALAKVVVTKVSGDHSGRIL